MTNKRLLSLMLIGLVIILLGILFIPSLFKGEYNEQRDISVKRVLSKYVESDLVDVDYVNDERKRFILTTKVLDYSGDLTIGDILAQVHEAQKRPEELELKVSFLEFIGLVANHFAKGTRFADHVQINQAPRAGHLNIYFLKEDPNGLTQHFKNNCSYIGYQDAIICDAAFVSTYLERFDHIDKLYDTLITEYDLGDAQGFEASLVKNQDLVSQYLKQNFLIWLIGHEIGHAILHKTVITRQSEQLHFDLNYDDHEKEADMFVARNVVTSPALGVHFRVLLGEFIQQEFRSLYRIQHPEESKQLTESEDRRLVLERKIIVDYSRYSLPVILRAMRLMEVISLDSATNERAQYGIIEGKVILMDSLGYSYHQIEGNIDIPAKPFSRNYIKYLILLVVCFTSIFILAKLRG